MLLPALPPVAAKRGTVFLALLLLAGCGSPAPRVVLYCAQDQEFAEQVFEPFKKATGLTITPRFDTEATKSVALYEELVREAGRPRCDVFWNNEILSTLRLARQGLLEPYASPAAAPYPPFAQGGSGGVAKDHAWHAFAARARVLLVHTGRLQGLAEPKSLLDLVQPEYKGQVAMSKPQAGTSATQAACLFEVLGKDDARRWYLGLRANGVHLLSGNKQVAEDVGQGRYAIGITDSDDAIAEVKAGRPVRIVFPDADRPAGERLGTLFIPNTVALVRGAPQAEAGKKLIDYLLSPEVEKVLAEGGSHQIPLNPQVQARLPEQLEKGRSAKPMAVDWAKAADLWDEAQSFLRNEFARP